MRFDQYFETDDVTYELKEKYARVVHLAEHGATEGERFAAQRAADRLVERYGVAIKTKSQATGFIWYTTGIAGFSVHAKLEIENGVCVRIVSIHHE